MSEIMDKYESFLIEHLNKYYHPSQKIILPLSIVFYIPLIITKNILGVISLSGLVFLHIHLVYRESKKWENNEKKIKPEDKKKDPLLGQKKDVNMKEKAKESLFESNKGGNNE